MSKDLLQKARKPIEAQRNATGPSLLTIRVDEIDANPEQPRKFFDDADIEALAKSIETHGLKQPICVTAKKAEGRYTLICGERRLRAYKRLGKKEIDAIVTEGDLFEVALLENVQRVDLDVFELADAYLKLVAKHGYTYDDLALVVGRSKSVVGRVMTLNRLTEEMREQYHALAKEDRPADSRLYDVAEGDDPKKHKARWAALLKRIEKERDERINGKPPKVKKEQPAIKTALPKKQAANLLKAHDALVAVRAKGESLFEDDVKMLRGIRNEIDGILGERTLEAAE